MAIEIEYDDGKGHVDSTAYVRVSHVVINYEQKAAEVTIQVFATADAAASGAHEVATFGYRTVNNERSNGDEFINYFADEKFVNLLNPRDLAYTFIKNRNRQPGESSPILSTGKDV